MQKGRDNKLHTQQESLITHTSRQRETDFSKKAGEIIASFILFIFISYFIKFT